MAIRSTSLRDYLGFAKKRDPQGFASRLKKVIECDEALITSKDQAFRFHSGIPLALANQTLFQQGTGNKDWIVKRLVIERRERLASIAVAMTDQLMATAQTRIG